MARRKKIVTRINLAVLLNLRERTEALARHGVVEMQLANQMVEQMLASITVECTIPTSEAITADEAARLGEIAANSPQDFIPALVRALQTHEVTEVLSRSTTKVHMELPTA